MDKNIQSQGEQKKLNMLQKMLGKLSMAKLSLVMVLASLMSLSCFATDGEPTTATISSMITEAGTSLPSLMTLVWSLMTANPLISLAVIAAIVSIGIGLLRRLRRVAH